MKSEKPADNSGTSPDGNSGLAESEKDTEDDLDLSIFDELDVLLNEEKKLHEDEERVSADDVSVSHPPEKEKAASPAAEPETKQPETEDSVLDEIPDSDVVAEVSSEESPSIPTDGAAEADAETGDPEITADDSGIPQAEETIPPRRSRNRIRKRRNYGKRTESETQKKEKIRRW